MSRSLVAAAALLAIAFAATESRAQADTPPQEPAPAPSDDEARYKRHMTLGVRLFEDRNFDAAIAEFERAYDVRPRASPLINIALCHKGRFDYVEAIAVLERALGEHRDTVDDPAKLQQAADEMRELLGRVTLEVQPPEAAVRLVLDGEPLDETATFPVGPGRHQLTIEADGFVPDHRRFRIASGETRRLVVELATARGVARIDAPAGATVTIDGRHHPGHEVTAQLTPGSHLLELAIDERRYTTSFATVAGETTRVVLDDDELLHVGDAPPRGPDAVEAPPVRGLYGLVLTDVGPRFGKRRDIRVAPGIRAGYRINTLIGVELEFHQVINVIETTDTSQAVGTTVARVNARLMTSSLPVRFVTTLGVGYAHDFDSVSTGNGFNVLAEPGLDVELSQVILGLALPVTIGLTNIDGGRLAFDFGGGIRAGYGFW